MHLRKNFIFDFGHGFDACMCKGFHVVLFGSMVWMHAFQQMILAAERFFMGKSMLNVQWHAWLAMAQDICMRADKTNLSRPCRLVIVEGTQPLGRTLAPC